MTLEIHANREKQPDEWHLRQQLRKAFEDGEPELFLETYIEWAQQDTVSWQPGFALACLMRDILQDNAPGDVTHDEREPAERWCLGHKVPVRIIMNDGTEWDGWKQPTVSALNPRRSKGPYPQPKGLFLDGPRWDDPNIAQIVAPTKQTCHTCGTKSVGEVDVTQFVRMSYGPGM